MKKERIFFVAGKATMMQNEKKKKKKLTLWARKAGIQVSNKTVI